MKVFLIKLPNEKGGIFMWHSSSVEEVSKNLKTNVNIGLSEDEAQKRFERYGPNNLKEKKKESIFVKFIKQFNDFMIITLIIAAIISAVVSKLNGEADYIDSIIIVAIVVFNAIMGLVQEQKAEKSLEALKKMSAPNAKVRRNGRVQEIDATMVVPGDVVILEAGNYVCRRWPAAGQSDSSPPWWGIPRRSRQCRRNTGSR